jgi:hypothetical protein
MDTEEKRIAFFKVLVEKQGLKVFIFKPPRIRSNMISKTGYQDRRPRSPQQLCLPIPSPKSNNGRAIHTSSQRCSQTRDLINSHRNFKINLPHVKSRRKLKRGIPHPKPSRNNVPSPICFNLDSKSSNHPTHFQLGRYYSRLSRMDDQRMDARFEIGRRGMESTGCGETR